MGTSNKKEKDFNFFAETDKNKAGELSSQFPAWYFDVHISELKESIASKKRALRDNRIPTEAIHDNKIELANMEDQLTAIEKSQPTLSDKEKDFLMKTYRAIRIKIQDTMFTRTDMLRGTADAHEEAKRMVNPIIELDKEQVGLAKSCGGKIYEVRGKSMVSRNDASKIYKIAGKLLGEPTNVEALRRDRATVETQAKVA